MRYFVLNEIRFIKLIQSDKAQLFELFNKFEKINIISIRNTIFIKIIYFSIE